ncbi:class I SAM-dependent methyltransferase [Virgibacillus alimentarius]|uniref:Site-specific DNA-methyltransferase (Adenine-specific) n=1 Tax=Virgibacillus alimentarius TaxID=698769 RepID=A0ABS4SD20_9BACI|nr:MULTISPECIES: class I SAM-dependent methyltransferase [Virgibacillus]MBP2258799.1 site-specific DNA-methyltransferase (adenine-specific) [Virgibacillus alimentarius]HLR69071.1 class I SAM-dependent methyltransferase [Virgibacillus sp.]
MDEIKVESLFEWLDRTTQIIHEQQDEPYLDSLAVTLETLFYQDVSAEIDDLLKYKLQSALKKVDLTTYQIEDIRKATQLAILKGMKGSTQQQHLMTPEAVALFVGYISEKLMKGKDKIRIFDLVSGTANLLLTVMNQLEQPAEAFASEIDPTLIKLGVLNANLQQKQVEFFHQDSLRPFLVDPIDLIIADLPVGYYPDDIRANDFQLSADKGHSYAHHLLIEQGMNYTKEAGYLIFVIPDFLFDSDQSDKLHAYIQEYAHIIGVIRLPESAFKSKKNVKSIFILQKKGKDTQGPKQPLLANLPSFNNTREMGDILDQMNGWFKQYI